MISPRNVLLNAEQVFISSLQRRPEAHTEGDIRADQASNIVDQAIVARGGLAGMASDIASGAVDDLESLATQTVCHDASAVADHPVQAGKTIPVFRQTKLGKCCLAGRRINYYVSFCHRALLNNRSRAPRITHALAVDSPAGGRDLALMASAPAHKLIRKEGQ